MDKIKMWETLKIIRLVCIGIGILGILLILIHSFWKGEKERSRVRWKRDKGSGLLGWLRFFKRRQHKLLNPNKLMRSSEAISSTKRESLEADASLESNDPFAALGSKEAGASLDGATSTDLDQMENRGSDTELHGDLASDASVDKASAPNPYSLGKAVFSARHSTLVVLYVSALPGAHFSRLALIRAFQSVGLTYGEREIYHRFLARNEETAKLFSVANLVKPGSLPLEQNPDFTTIGLTLFMQLHALDAEASQKGLGTGAYLEGMQVFELMLEVARSLARLLKGVVLDEQRKLLTPTKVTALGRLLQSKRLYVPVSLPEEEAME